MEQLKGLKRTLTNDEYHSCKEWLSKSMMDKLRRSPAHLRASILEPLEQTPAMAFGSAMHTFLLERSKFEERYAIKPKFDKRTKDGKRDSDIFDERNAGKECITEIEYSKLNAMAYAIKCHTDANKLMDMPGECETSAFSELENCMVKARFDKLTTMICIDLKSTEDASPIEFAKSVVNYRYHVQAAFYLDVLESLGQPQNKFIFIAIEKEPPYAVACYELEDDAINEGRRIYKQQIELYKQCVELDIWPAYGQQIEKLSLPKWAYNKQ